MLIRGLDRCCIALVACLLCMPLPSLLGAEALPQRHLIVAPMRFHSGLEGYIEHKQKQLKTSLVSLEAVLQSTEGVDDAEKLKKYLYAAWKSEPLGYVLLVGDADLLPVRYMVLDRVTKPAFDYAFYPSDLYYSDLAKSDGSFDDWNGSKKDFHAGYFGEVRGEANKLDPINYDAIDYRPDVAVGRWPVNTLEEVEISVSKVIAYETAIQSGNKPGLRSAALFSVSGWVDSRSVMDGVAEKLGTTWTIQKRYYNSPHRAVEIPPSETGLVQLLNEGVGIVMHAGHGQDDRWEQCFPLSAFSKLHNADRLPIVLSAGCSTARFATLPPYEAYVDIHGDVHRGTNFGEVFDSPPVPPNCYQSGTHNPTGLGEQLLRRGPDGAIAYIGCNTGSQPCGLALLTGFAKSYEEATNPRLGDCWNGAILFYHEDQKLTELKPNSDWYPPSIFFQGMKFMCFGDPSLMMPLRAR